MKISFMIVLTGLLAGCAINLRTCPEPDYASFAEFMDLVAAAQKKGLSQDAAMRLYAIRAQLLRTEQIVMQEHCW